MACNGNRLLKCACVMSGMILWSGSFAGVVQAVVLPAWMEATGNATITLGNPVTAGFHRAESGVGTIAGGATYTLNSGSLNNWIFRDDGDYDSFPSGSPLDMTYSSSRTLDFSVVAPDTLRIQSTESSGATGPAFGEGDDTAFEQRLLRIVAQSDVEVIITSSGLGTGSIGAGSGGYTYTQSWGGLYEDLTLISPTIDGTFNLVAGRTYDIFGAVRFTVHENLEGFPNSSWGQSNYGTIDIQVVPEPTSVALLAMGGLVILRRYRSGAL